MAEIVFQLSLSDLFIDYEIEVRQSFFLWGLDSPRLQRKNSPTIHIYCPLILDHGHGATYMNFMFIRKS